MKELLFMVVVVLLAFAYPRYKSYHADVQVAARTAEADNVFIADSPKLVELSPRIIEAVLLEEDADYMVFDVSYIIPDMAEDGVYNLSVHPDMSHWAYTSNALKRGERDRVRVKVSFNPQDESVTRAESSKIHFYISHARGGRYVGEDDRRDVDYPKVWMFKNR